MDLRPSRLGMVMPFLAQCPYCRRKARVPDHAAGWSLECRKCGSSFTVVSTQPLPAAAVTTSNAPALHETAEVPALAPPATAPPEQIPYEPVASASGGFRFGLTGAAVLALGLVGLALVAAALPGYSNAAALPAVLAALALCAAALLVGLVGVFLCLLSRRGHPAWPGGAAVAGLVLLGLTAFRPTLLGGPRAEFWLPRPPETGKAVHVPIRGSGGGTADIADGSWTDATKETVQIDEVRIRVLSATLRPVEVSGPDGKPRPTRERFFVVRLRVQNQSVTRKVEFDSWAGAPTAERPAPTLTDNANKTYKLRTPPGLPPPPGRTPLAAFQAAEDVLVFEPPTANVEYLRLELPASAFGAAGKVRLQIPRTMVR